MPAQKKRQWRRKDHMHFLAREKSWAPTEMTFIVLKKIPAQTPGPASAMASSQATSCTPSLPSSERSGGWYPDWVAGA